MSYVELDEHPKKHSLMTTAFTLQSGIDGGMEIIRKNEESKRRVKE